jgi:hypothetical protein
LPKENVAQLSIEARRKVRENIMFVFKGLKKELTKTAFHEISSAVAQAHQQRKEKYLDASSSKRVGSISSSVIKAFGGIELRLQHRDNCEEFTDDEIEKHLRYFHQNSTANIQGSKTNSFDTFAIFVLMIIACDGNTLQH